MECVELAGVFNECAVLLASTVEPAPSSTTSTQGEEGSFVQDWGVILGAVIGIGGTLFTQLISGRNEAKRLENQHKREDESGRRSERKLLYAELLKHLDEYMIVILKRKHLEPIVQALALGDTNGGTFLEAKEELSLVSERSSGLTSGILTTLGVIDLVGDRKVFDYAYAYFGEIRDIDPESTTAKQRAHLLNTWMKTAMRASLAGEELPEGMDLEWVKSQKNVEDTLNRWANPEDEGKKE